MISSDILSKIRIEKLKLGKNEGINFENTFIQQTSGGQNLWKVQLGETNNYILFFKQEVTLEETPCDRFLLQMFPKDSFYVQKCPGRKLEVTFPKGIKSYFKLPVGRGCGTAWAKWRRLPDTCGRMSVSQKPQFAVFNTHELSADILRTLKEKGFTTPLFLSKSSSQGILEAGWLLWMKSNAPEESDRAFELPELVASTSLENKINKWLESGKRVVPKRAGHNPRGRKGSKKPVVKLSRVVQRFGEGVPDGCTFNLSLTTNYPAEDPDSSNTFGKDPMCHHVRSSSKRRNQKLNIFEYLCKERLASDGTYMPDKLEHKCLLQGYGPPPVRSPKKNLVNSLDASLTGPILVYGKNLADRERPLLASSHSGPLQSYEKLLAEFEKPSLKASDLDPLPRPKKSLADTAKRPFKSSQPPVILRNLKKKLVDSAYPSLEASHSGSVRSPKKNLSDSEKRSLEASHSGPVRSPKKNLVDSANRSLEGSHSGPVWNPRKNQVDSANRLLETSQPVPVVPVWSSKQNLADFEKPQLKASQLVPVRSPKKKLADSPKPTLEDNFNPVQSFVKNLVGTAKRSLEDGDWESNIPISRTVQKDASSYIEFTKPLAHPSPDVSSRSRIFGSILRPFHYLLEPRKWSAKLVPSSKTFQCTEPVSRKRR